LEPHPPQAEPVGEGVQLVKVVGDQRDASRPTAAAIIASST